jgi:hypothetical protein
MNKMTNETRKNNGFYSAEDAVAVVGSQNTVFDPSSLLISESITVGHGNVFYPNVVIQCDESGRIEIGDNNTFYPGTFIVCKGGLVIIGTANTFGPAGCTLQTNDDKALIMIGDNGRYCNGVNMIGQAELGSGSQVLGSITVQNCHLEAGGNFSEPDPDKRGAVLKGFGMARGLDLKVGQVVNGAGDFSNSQIEWQRAYHPKATQK